MLIHLDTSVLVDAFTGSRRALSHVAAATSAGHVIAFCALVQYEWLRGPRASGEDEAVRRFFGDDAIVAFGFGSREAETAAALYRRVKRAANGRPTWPSRRAPSNATHSSGRSTGPISLTSRD